MVLVFFFFAILICSVVCCYKWDDFNLAGKLTETSEGENGESSEPQSSESGESAPLSGSVSSKGKDTSSGTVGVMTTRSGSVSSDAPSIALRTATLRLSTDHGPAEHRLNMKHSDLVNDIQNTLINNKMNNDKGQKCLNVTVKQTSDSSTDTPKSDINPLKTRRIVKSDSGSIESKRLKLSEFNWLANYIFYNFTQSRWVK